jgi:ATP-binding cassette, subfamily B, multidrug efflux pump
MAHEEEVLGKAYDARLMRRLLKYLKPYRIQVGLAIVMTIFMSALGPLRPYLTKIAIDDYILKNNFSGLQVIIALLVGSVIVQAIVQYAQAVGTQWIGQKTIYDLRVELFAHLQRLSFRFLDKNPVGRLVTRLTSDIEVLNELFSSGIIMVFADVFVLVWIFIFMFATSWKLALVVCVVFPFLLIATAIFRKKARESYREVRLLVARMNAFLNEHVSGMITVQLFGRESHTWRSFDRINRDHADANIKSVFYYAVFYPSIELLSSVAFALIVWYGGSLVLGRDINAGEALTLGTLIAFIQYTEQFFRPVRDLAEKYNILQGAMASSERVFKLLDEEPEVPVTTSAISTNGSAVKDVRGEIEFKDVWFAYNDEDWVLKNISFKINAGETVAFVGATGAGKTSITNLVTRFYDFQRGSILLDGKDIRSFDDHELRRNIAIVLQDVFLFSSDVETNITLGSEHITSEQARRAAEIVGAAPFIERLPEGYAAQVKERGAILSVGQKQLISFARALAHDPRILILDEATSSIDTESELLIQHAIEELLKGRTSIVIAHRLSTIQKADKIIVLHKGEIREMGSHDELLKQNGIYRTLYELQYKDQEAAPKAITNGVAASNAAVAG